MVEYSSGTPTENGVYACRLPEGGTSALWRDTFLLWYGGQWHYLRSDQQFRGEVPYWIGPLQRATRPITRKPKDETLHG